MADYSILQVPRQWPAQIRSAFIHTVSLASAVFTSTCALAANRKSTEPRHKSELAQAYHEIALLQEELNIKHERFQKIPSLKRPQYSPIQRMRILNLRAARKWTVGQTAKAFHLSILTVISWIRRVDEEGEQALLQLKEPVSKFPEFVRSIVRQLKAFFPGLGKVKIAQYLSRAGLHIGATTVGRFIKEEPFNGYKSEFPELEGNESVKPKIVTAKYPGHVFHLDLSTIPTSAGFWSSCFPFTLLQAWPFCWWVAVVIDHFSRSVIGFAVFKKKPNSLEVRLFLGRAFQKAQVQPKHLITDKDNIFFCDAFKKWCKRKNTRPRFGAIGKHGSIAVIERFFRTMKQECFRKIRVPFRLDAMRNESAYYFSWYNEYRPHTFLDGRTPHEVYEGLTCSSQNFR